MSVWIKKRRRTDRPDYRRKNKHQKEEKKMQSFILSNKDYMNLLARLDEETWRKVLSKMRGPEYEKIEVASRIRKIKRGRIIVHIPHASLQVPDFFVERLNVDKDYFDGMNVFESDYLIDEFKPDDFECLIFPYSRMFCDVERFRDDGKEIMALWHRRGVVYERDANRKEFINIDPDYKNRILNEFYDDHHRKFSHLVRDKINTYGDCLIIDLHSFSDEYERKTGIPFGGKVTNPDICIGLNNYERVKGMVEKIQCLCNKYGYTNTLNRPYSGSIVPMDYMDDRRVISIMLEINKRIYLNGEMNGLDQEKSDKLSMFLKDFYKSL
jgi:N-formylglutamate amidohydrolase